MTTDHSRALTAEIDATLAHVPVLAAHLAASLVRVPLLLAQLATALIAVPFMGAQLGTNALDQLARRLDHQVAESLGHRQPAQTKKTGPRDTQQRQRYQAWEDQTFAQRSQRVAEHRAEVAAGQGQTAS
jgi:hypothetical protein